MPTNYSKIRRHFPQRFKKVKWNVITLSRLPTVRPNEARGGTKYWKKIRTLLKLLKTNWRPVKTTCDQMRRRHQEKKDFHKIITLQRSYSCFEKNMTLPAKKIDGLEDKRQMRKKWNEHSVKSHWKGSFNRGASEPFFNERFNQTVYRVSISVRRLFFPSLLYRLRGPFDDGIWMKFMRL